jgi:hypothetical protein
MNLWNSVVGWATSARRTEAIERTVFRVTPLVLERVGRAPFAMGTNEARGYIRSRALSPLRKETEQILSQEYPQLASQRDDILTEALEMVTRAVMVQMREQMRTRFVLRKAA